MECLECASIRSYLGKTQDELASMLRLSSETIQGYEDGGISIPPSAERQMLFLLLLKKVMNRNINNCWDVLKCPVEWKDKCPAWEIKSGRFCWFINETYCHGELKTGWEEKMLVCRQCEYFQSLLPDKIHIK